MILQKAWAKLNGGYKRIENAHLGELLQDFTSAPITYLQIKDKKLYEKLKDAF